MARMDDDFKQDLIDAMRGVLPSMLRQELKPILRQELRPILRQELKPVLREELKPLLQEELEPIHEELALIRQVQGAQGLRLNAIYSTVSVMKNTLRSHSHELKRLNVLMEDYNDRLAGIGELHSS